MTDGVQAAIVARIAEALAKWERSSDVVLDSDRWKATAVADALGLAAILSIVEERRNAHSPYSCASSARFSETGQKCHECGLSWPCDERRALDAIHNHLTGGAE